MSLPLVTVFGATGLQGSSVARALLKDGGFAVRGVTRNANSAAAQALKAAGAEIVEANLLLKETVVNAISGSEAVFAVTNFWDKDHFDPKKLQDLNPDFKQDELAEPEYVQGKNLVEAAKAGGVQFFIWSSLPSTSEISTALHQKDPKIKEYKNIEHYDLKARVEKLLEASGLNYAILHTGWFLENLWNFGVLRKDENGTYMIVAPKFKADDAPVAPGQEGPEQAFTWVTQVLGQSVLALLNNYKAKGPEIFGKTFYAVNERAPYERLAKALSESLGREVGFSGEGSTGLAELDETSEYQARIGTYRDVVIPDPRLVAWGAKFSTLNDFASDEEVKAKLNLK